MATRKIELHGTVRDGNLVLDVMQKQMRSTFLASLEKRAVTETIALAKKPKSGEQLGAIFGLIIATVKRELDDRGWDIYGAPWTEAQIKKCLYAGYHKYSGTTKTLRDMDQAEASAFMDWCFTFCAGDPWRVFIPNPDPNWRQTGGGEV